MAPVPKTSTRALAVADSEWRLEDKKCLQSQRSQQSTSGPDTRKSGIGALLFGERPVWHPGILYDLQLVLHFVLSALLLDRRPYIAELWSRGLRGHCVRQWEAGRLPPRRLLLVHARYYQLSQKWWRERAVSDAERELKDADSDCDTDSSSSTILQTAIVSFLHRTMSCTSDLHVISC